MAEPVPWAVGIFNQNNHWYERGSVNEWWRKELQSVNFSNILYFFCEISLGTWDLYDIDQAENVVHI